MARGEELNFVQKRFLVQRFACFEKEIRFVVNRTRDGQPLSGKIRTAWDGILKDACLGEDVVRHSLRHTAATWLMQLGTEPTR
jgi:hypothetical protein